jgi:RNA polymerase sigma-70 factor (sigma-E family)
MTQPSREIGFEEYVAAKQQGLLRYAYLLCGDWHRAQDATATALSKLFLHWPKIRRAGAEDAYARTVLRRVLIDDSRRPWRREEPSAELPDVPRAAEAGYEERAHLLAALMELPIKQRQCVALRYWLDLSVEHTAQELGISLSAVKTHTHRGLARLRAALVDAGGIQ